MDNDYFHMAPMGKLQGLLLAAVRYENV